MKTHTSFLEVIIGDFVPKNALESAITMSYYNKDFWQ
jgi:hypothetical protein